MGKSAPAPPENKRRPCPDGVRKHRRKGRGANEGVQTAILKDLATCSFTGSIVSIIVFCARAPRSLTCTDTASTCLRANSACSATRSDRRLDRERSLHEIEIGLGVRAQGLERLGVDRRSRLPSRRPGSVRTRSRRRRRKPSLLTKAARDSVTPFSSAVRTLSCISAAGSTTAATASSTLGITDVEIRLNGSGSPGGVFLWGDSHFFPLVLEGGSNRRTFSSNRE